MNWKMTQWFLTGGVKYLIQMAWKTLRETWNAADPSNLIWTPCKQVCLFNKKVVGAYKWGLIYYRGNIQLVIIKEHNISSKKTTAAFLVGPLGIKFGVVLNSNCSLMCRRKSEGHIVWQKWCVWSGWFFCYYCSSQTDAAASLRSSLLVPQSVMDNGRW